MGHTCVGRMRQVRVDTLSGHENTQCLARAYAEDGEKVQEATEPHADNQSCLSFLQRFLSSFP